MRMTKKVLAFVLAVAVLTTVLPIGGIETKAAEGMESTSADDFSYEVRDDGVHITRYNGSAATVVIPSEIEGEKVVEIGDFAFYWHGSLTSITIPDSVMKIGREAFGKCSSLTSITIPKSVLEIGNRVFYNCSKLNTIVVEEENPNYRSEDGVLYNKEQTKLICCSPQKIEAKILDSVMKIEDDAFYDCSSLTSITIPNGVTEIGSSAFYNCSGLTSIAIPSSVTKIGKYAFYNCSSLTSIMIPNGATEIGSNAFYNCNGLTSITIPSSVTKIGEYAFYNCSSLTNIMIPNGVTEIGSGAFCHCNGLTSITIPSSVTQIGDDAFYGCSGLTSITIPDSVTEIGSGAFSSCRELNSIVVEEGNLNYRNEDGVLYNKEQTELICCPSQKTEVEIPKGVLKIGNNAFASCQRLTSITIPDGVTEIGYGAFSCCSGLTSITIPDSIRYISFDAFQNCNGITKLIIAAGSKIITSKMVVCSNQLKEVVIPNSVREIEESVFQNCKNLNRFIVEEDNQKYSLKADVLYNKEQTELICCPKQKTEVEISKEVLKIGASAFSDCRNLASITIPGSVTKIGDYAFNNCSGLTSITISDSVTKIGNYAFYNCSSLASITIPDSVTQIGERTFNNCSGLTSITIPDNVTKIGNYAFYNCSSLTSITIPDSVIEIEDSAFYMCSGLTSITIPDSVTQIGDDAFSYCENLTSIILPDRDMEIGATAFWRTAYMENEANWEGNALYIGKHLIEARTGTDSSFEIKAGTRTIASKVFGEVSSGTWVWHYTGSSIETVVIPDSVTTIAYQAFYDCDNLTKVEIPSSVTKINRAFDCCYQLEEIKVDEKNANYSSEDGILYNKAQTEVIRCPEGRTAAVTLPDSVTQIGECAFYKCSLTDLTLPNGVTRIKSYAFCQSSLASILIPDSVTQIGVDAFAYTDYWYEKANWENDVLYIGNHLIGVLIQTSSHCTVKPGTKTISAGALGSDWSVNLTSITIPDSVVYIGGDTRNCLSDLVVYYGGTPAQWKQIEIDESQGTPKEIIFVSEDEEPGSTCDFTYFEKEDGLYITGYTGQDTIITIPNQIEGKKVVGIADKAFAGCSTLENVTLPDTLLSIGVRAFEGCNRLKSIIIPDSVTQIRQSAFIGCSDLTSITIPDSVMQIGGEAFSDTGYWDEDANWEDGALYIGTHLIETNPEIAPDYVVKEGTTTISLCDFQYITSLTIPDSVKYLGCEEPDRYLVMEEDRLPKVTVYYKGTQEQWNQIVIDESQGAPKEVVYTKASISYGDATGDQIIDMKDVVLLRKYMAEFDYDSNTSTVAVAAGGDVNGDGIFDMKDVVLLRKYIADFDYDTGSSGVVLGP